MGYQTGRRHRPAKRRRSTPPADEPESGPGRLRRCRPGSARGGAASPGAACRGRRLPHPYPYLRCWPRPERMNHHLTHPHHLFLLFLAGQLNWCSQPWMGRCCCRLRARPTSTHRASSGYGNGYPAATTGTCRSPIPAGGDPNSASPQVHPNSAETEPLPGGERDRYRPPARGTDQASPVAATSRSTLSSRTRCRP